MSITNRGPVASQSEAIFAAMSVGDRVRYSLEVRGTTQTALAEAIGIGQAAISNIVNDKSRKPSAPTLVAMASALMINPSWILNGLGDPYGWAPITEPAQVELLNLFRALDQRTRSGLLNGLRAAIAAMK